MQFKQFGKRHAIMMVVMVLSLGSFQGRSTRDITHVGVMNKSSTWRGAKPQAAPRGPCLLTPPGASTFSRCRAWLYCRQKELKDPSEGFSIVTVNKIRYCTQTQSKWLTLNTEASFKDTLSMYSSQDCFFYLYFLQILFCLFFSFAFNR